MSDERSTVNGHNGYLADGTRVQVPSDHRHSVYMVHDYEWPPLVSTMPTATVHATERVLRVLRYIYPCDIPGPVEGDGSWLDDWDGARIVTLWAEEGSAAWERWNRAGS